MLLSKVEYLAKIDYIWEHKTVLKHFKRIQVMQCILSDHSGIKFKTYIRKTSMKPPNNWELNNILLPNIEVRKEIKWEVRKYFELNENEQKNISKLKRCF